MKFGEKYELLESLTTGGVETFVANDKVRGERVLVHILECEAQKPNQPTVQWVLEAFRRIAPEPAALVLETGRYSGTLYGYLVTKMPDEAALTKWVRLYRAQVRETQDIPGPLAKPTPESECPTADMSVKARPPMPAAVTPPAFKDFSATPKPDKPSVPTKEADYPAQAMTQAKPAGDRSEIRLAPDWNAVTPGIAAQGKSGPTSNPPDSFSSVFAPQKFSSEANPPAVKDSPGPGEFTKFFQGPFRVDGPPETPSVPSQPIEPPRKNVGEFTAMFNPPRTGEPPSAGGIAGNEPPGTGFTGFFSNPNLAPRTSGAAGAPPSSGLPQSGFDEPPAFPALPKEPFIPVQPVPYLPPTPIVSIPPVFPVPPPPPFPTPVIEKPPVVPHAGSASEGATNAFNRQVSEAPPNRPVPPSGPSQYTQVISARRPAETIAPEKHAATNSAANFPMPTMPPVPSIAPPPMPATPAMPKLAAPGAPKPAKTAVSEPTVSYWPLILTLTVLFFIAVLLVLYFALKH